MSISLKELKKNRLTPAERFVLETIEGAKPTTYPNSDVDWWDKDGRYLFIQDFKKGFLWVSNNQIWRVLDKGFGLNENEIIELLSNILYDYTNKGKLKIK